MNTQLDEIDRVHVNHSVNASWLDIGNALYTASMRCLLQGFDSVDRAGKAAWLSASFALMRATVPVGQGLAARPARDAGGPPHAGLTFTSLRTLATLPSCSDATVVAARLGELRLRAEELPLALVEGESAATWQEVIDALETQRSRLATLAGDSVLPTVAPPVAPAMPTPQPAPAAPAEPASPIEVARGRSVTVLFEARRCIHSRHCVLEAPTVFKANTPGEWIFPDTAPLETVVEVAHRCPSGAIRYERHDGGPAESAPPVNTIRIRENGPYAVSAPIVLRGVDDGFRATLCRCGQSARKPWCDGSHATAGFVASGEPPTGSADPLASRDGPLAVTPLRNGPLHVIGNLEICAGTGRTVARVTEARLCRCGQSRSKPFCDLSHVAAGFEADGD